MARIRSIKPTIWTDEKLVDLAPIHRLVFLGLISQADDEGRLIDSVKAIDGALFAGTDDSCAASLEVLANRSRIIRYCGQNGQRVIQIANWEKHQRISHPYPSTLPPLTRSGMLLESNGSHSSLGPESFRPDVEVEVDEEKDVQTQIGRDGTAAIARAVTGPRSLEVSKRTFTKAEVVARVNELADAGFNGRHPSQEAHVPPRPPGVPDPDHALPAPNGPEPYLDDRRAAAAWVKQHPAEFAELQRRVTLENPHSESAGGRKAFLSALLLGRVVRILRGHDPLSTPEGPAPAVQGVTHRASGAEAGAGGPTSEVGQAEGASNAPVVAP